MAGVKFLETDMYPPVKKYLESAGYTVTAEVKGADVTAVKSDELIILELKKQFNVKLLFQALERQRVTGDVYIVLPRPKRANSPQFKHIRHIAESLGLGLMTVAMDSGLKTVEVIHNPSLIENNKTTLKANEKKKRALLLEIAGRSSDGNNGGSSKKKLMTAYREKCLRLACVLYENGPQQARDLTGKFGCEKDSYQIMYQNHYNWFCRVEPGTFGLSEEGIVAVTGDNEYREIINYYRGAGIK